MVAFARRARRTVDIWPGWVDALSTLVMVIIFVLLVLVISQTYLSATLSGREETLKRLNQQVAELAGHSRPAVDVGFGTGWIGREGGRTAIAKALEGRPGGMRMTAEMAGDARCRPANVGQQDHFQPAPGHGRQIGPAKRPKVRSLGIG